MLSHELRTPLTAIKGYAQLLGRKGQDRPGHEQRALEAINVQSDHMLKLIEDLLCMAELARGPLKLHKTPVHLGELASRAIQELPRRSKHHTIQLQVDESLPLIEGDGSRLLSVLVNLIGNAIKYSPKGGTVVVTVRAGQGEVSVTVRDEGIGIPLKYQDRVFEPFYQVDSSCTRRFSGAGLGLYVSKGIIEAHGGRIWMQSEPGHGSTFGFSLPAFRAEDRRTRGGEIDK